MLLTLYDTLNCTQSCNNEKKKKYSYSIVYSLPTIAQHKKASNHHANLPLEMYSFTL